VYLLSQITQQINVIAACLSATKSRRQAHRRAASIHCSREEQTQAISGLDFAASFGK
jgi:hypothetical protein